MMEDIMKRGFYMEISNMAMLNKKIQSFLDELKVNYIKNASLREYTTFKIGGNTPFLIVINTIEEIKNVIKFFSQNNIKFLIIGKGSNLLITDDGLSYPVIKIDYGFSGITVSDDTITCQSGVTLAKLCKTAYEHNLTGVEFAWGIPGTVGGGIYMNAGAYGGEINDIIFSCNGVNEQGDTIRLEKSELMMGYRTSIFQTDEYVITQGVFKLKKGNRKEIKSKMDEYFNRRKEKQPLEFPSAGSTFRRPNGAYAGTLIEECALKGFSIGGASVSKKHAGFIINKNGNASFDDVYTLISHIQKTVKELTNYDLTCEIKIIK